MFTHKRTTAPLASPVQSRERSPFWWLRWVPTVVLIVLLLDFIYIVGSVAIVPVLASFAIAYVLNPLVYQIEKRGLSRALSALAALMIVTLAIAGFLAFVTPELWEKSIDAGQKVMTYMTAENGRRQRAAI